jgi:hypothetical protein
LSWALDRAARPGRERAALWWGPACRERFLLLVWLGQVSCENGHQEWAGGMWRGQSGETGGTPAAMT